MRKSSSFAAILLILVSACASPQKKISQALQSGGSWSAASAMCLDAYRNASLTDAFAKKFLDDAQKELSKAVESARKAGATPADSLLIERAAALAAAAKAAVESHDDATSREVSENLRNLSNVLTARSKAAETSS